MKTLVRLLIRLVLGLIDLALFAPCVLVLNDNTSFIPNIIGLIWCGLLALGFKTGVGQWFLEMNNVAFWHFLDK